MSQTEIDQAVVRATGESMRAVRRHGFSLLSPVALFDPDDFAMAEPLVVDWDQVQADRRARAA
jgi:hypothetical protein